MFYENCSYLLSTFPSIYSEFQFKQKYILENSSLTSVTTINRKPVWCREYIFNKCSMTISVYLQKQMSVCFSHYFNNVFLFVNINEKKF